APSGWANMTYGQSIDGRSASSATVNDSVVVSGFGVRVLRDSVTAVAYAVLLDRSATSPGQYLGVEFSSDRGLSWSQRTEIRTVNRFVRVDLTAERVWTLANVTPGAFQLRLTHLADGNSTGLLSLNFASLQVVWLSYWPVMGTDPVGEELYVEAARALGASARRIIWRYIASNVLVAIPVIFSLSAADAVLTAAGLSYLGLGVEAPTADWGLDLSAASSRISVGIWW